MSRTWAYRLIPIIVMAFLLFSTALNALENERPSEETHRDAQTKLADFDQGISLQDRRDLKLTGHRERERLSPRLRALFDERTRLKEEATYWENVVHLKRDLLSLPGVEVNSEASGLARAKRLRGGLGEAAELLPHEKEAEAIAKIGIRGFGELRRKYEMLRPAIFHNMLVNMGLKGEGLCWQWTRDLTKRLMKLDLKTFDLLWATARGGTMREHNTVVLVSRGRDLQEGLFLDGWTRSGSPFWMRVKDDKKHPWRPGSYTGDDLTAE